MLRILGAKRMSVGAPVGTNNEHVVVKDRIRCLYLAPVNHLREWHARDAVVWILHERVRVKLLRHQGKQGRLQGCQNAGDRMQRYSPAHL